MRLCVCLFFAFLLKGKRFLLNALSLPPTPPKEGGTKRTERKKQSQFLEIGKQKHHGKTSSRTEDLNANLTVEKTWLPQMFPFVKMRQDLGRTMNLRKSSEKAALRKAPLKSKLSSSPQSTVPHPRHLLNADSTKTVSWGPELRTQGEQCRGSFLKTNVVKIFIY